MSVSLMDPHQLSCYGRLCGWALARAHARTGRAAMIAGYLGGSEDFDHAIADFAIVYAGQIEGDYQQLRRAISDARILVAEVRPSERLFSSAREGPCCGVPDGSDSTHKGQLCRERGRGSLARWLFGLAGLGLTVLRDLLRSCLVHVAVQDGVKLERPQPRSGEDERA